MWLDEAKGAEGLSAGAIDIDAHSWMTGRSCAIKIALCMCPGEAIDCRDRA